MSLQDATHALTDRLRRPVPFNGVTLHNALASIDDWITEGAHEYVCLTDLRGLRESQGNERVRGIHDDAALVIVDANRLAWFNQFLPRRWTQRIAAAELLLACCELSLTAGYRHFFYGGPPGAAARLADRLTCRLPGLSVAGCLPAPARRISADEDRQLIQEINGSAPDIVWVGLASPGQEYWIAEHIGGLRAPVVVGLGALPGVTEPNAGAEPRRWSWWFLRRAAGWASSFVPESRSARTEAR